MSALSPHFKTEEFCCKCGKCGNECKINLDLINALEELRDGVDKPIIILSGYRCPNSNKMANGVSHSQHLLGNAADIRIPGFTLQQMYEAAKRVFAFSDGGIGVYDGNFLHVDVRKTKARWARVEDKYVALSELVTA